jgi:glycosyltransferase involved in cell wall biosynthesis
VALFTGGSDKPYVLGLVPQLLSRGVSIDLIGSNELECLELLNQSGVNFLNLRGDTSPHASFPSKMLRILRYYAKLVRYAANAEPKIFHILWNNKFEVFDRTLLMLYYKILGKKLVLTAHNVNAGKRDEQDGFINRFSLRVQYRLCDTIFLHTEKMKRELIQSFGVAENRTCVIPFGINNTVPNTALTPPEAKAQLGFTRGERTILFFGRITPYKGLEYLVTAFRELFAEDQSYRLIVAGRPDNCEEYWNRVKESMQEDVRAGRILLRSEFIPDEMTEVYFKASDVLVLPYRKIYQSGVLFLGYSFGVPVLAADVGSLKDDVVEGTTGFTFESENPTKLKEAIQKFYRSELFANLSARRYDIQALVAEQHSWQTVGGLTLGVYHSVQRDFNPAKFLNSKSPSHSNPTSSSPHPIDGVHSKELGRDNAAKSAVERESRAIQ